MRPLLKASITLFIIGIVFLGCKKRVFKLNISGTVTNFYTQAPISSGFVKVTSFLNFIDMSNSGNEEPYTQAMFAFGAAIGQDGAYTFSLEEQDVAYHEEWYMVVYDSNFISEPFEIKSNQSERIDIVCKPYRTLGLVVDVADNTSAQWNLEVVSDEKLRYFQSLPNSPTFPNFVQDDTLFFRVVPDAPCAITARQSNVSSGFDFTVTISNVDTTFFDIAL
ncbi:MAG: hypothetical protein JKY52_04785 [Flavobacteriales bacterium]|nr:hypothetical protein [Flavobacteriales bacterium]